jgi:hypothetical protein
VRVSTYIHTDARSTGAVVKPGNPPYLEYVRSTVQQKRERFNRDTGLGLETLSDWEKSQYNMAKGGQVDTTQVHGNPNLVYSSNFVEGWEPSGVPVSHSTLGMLHGTLCTHILISYFTLRTQ